MSRISKSTAIDTNQTLDSLVLQVLNTALVACDAKSGSLMMVDNKRGVLQIKARLGTPKAGRTNEPIFFAGDSSIAGWVAKHKKPYLCKDVAKDHHFSASRSGKNFASLLSVPIVHNGKLLAVINADSRETNYFTKRHQNRLQRVADQISKPLAERISITDALAQIGVELTRLPKGGGVDLVLSKIANLALRALGADIITLYQYSQEKDTFLVEGKGPTIAGAINNPGPMNRKVHPGDVPFRVVKEGRSGFYPDVGNEPFLRDPVSRPGEQNRPRFIKREGIHSMAALLLPFQAGKQHNNEVVGVMFASYRSPHEFNIDEVAALASFADYAAVAILNARVEEQHYTEQMRMVEAMAANFAHRMGNLAGASRVAVQELRPFLSNHNKVAAQHLATIMQRADVLLELSGRLARPFKETGHMFKVEPINLCEIVTTEVLQVCNDEALDIDYERRHLRQMPAALSVGFQLRQVLHDLLTNAAQAVRGVEDPQITINARYNKVASKIELEITDNGSGIPPDIRERLFNPGVTTKKDSLGIGLWWSRTFMQATGGNLTLKHTELGRGTTFQLEVPASAEDKSTATGKRRKPVRDILVVDDEPTLARQIKSIALSLKYSVTTAATRAVAESRLERYTFKLAILDIRLVDSDDTNVDGLELLRQIEHSGERTKVIILSSYSDDYAHIADSHKCLLLCLHKQTLNTKNLRTLLRNHIRPTPKRAVKGS